MAIRIIGKVSLTVTVACLLAVQLHAQGLSQLAREVTSRPSLETSRYPTLAMLAEEMHGGSWRLPRFDEEAAYVAPPGVSSYLEDPQAIDSNPWADLQMAQNGDRGNGDSGGGGGGDASDPTNVAFHVMFEWEWQHLNQNQGNLLAFKISPFIPVELAQQKFLFNFEVPVPQYAGLTGVNHSSGIGDTRLKFFWLISTGGEKVRAVVPSFDAIAPTGDEDRGLGGGQWILMPNMVFALQPTKNWSMYPFFRYVHADPVQTNFVIDPPLPEDPDLFGTTELRGFNLEWINVIQLEDAFFNWVEATPDYFKNFTGDRSETFTMKYTAAREVSDGLFLLFDFWHPVGGSQTNDYTFKIRLDWYPDTDQCKRCRGRCRCRRR